MAKPIRLGVDFGTTRLVVSAVDRGNYPVVQFETPDGDAYDWYPPLVAERDGERRYGWEAWALQGEPGWTTVRSLKRLLGHAGPHTTVAVGSSSIPLARLLDEMVGHFREQLLEHSSLPGAGSKDIEIYAGVPAHANTNQRFLTAEAFRNRGFEILGLLNEPTASIVEYGHLQRQASKAGQAGTLLVYDLGGGTFDVSLIDFSGDAHTVLATAGVAELGGDDFDALLAELALDAAGLSQSEREAIGQAEWFRLQEDCRLHKESLHPNTRRVMVDLEGIVPGVGTVPVAVADYYERLRPLIEQSLNATAEVLARGGFDEAGASTAEGEAPIETLYMTGGASQLPLVPRMLRERFGRRVKRSAHARSSAAIGLAIQADETKQYAVRDRFTRHFGVWREAESGATIAFDPLFARDTALPQQDEPPIKIERTYQPVHNIGHFRFLECSNVTDHGLPSGEIMLWDDIRFPFAPTLESAPDLAQLTVDREFVPEHNPITETYTCDSSGRITVAITNEASGFRQEFPLGKWRKEKKSVKPGRKKKRTTTKRARA